MDNSLKLWITSGGGADSLEAPVDDFPAMPEPAVDNFVDGRGMCVEHSFAIPHRCGHFWGQLVCAVDDFPVSAASIHMRLPCVPNIPATYQLTTRHM